MKKLFEKNKKDCPLYDEDSTDCKGKYIKSDPHGLGDTYGNCTYNTCPHMYWLKIFHERNTTI